MLYFLKRLILVPVGFVLGSVAAMIVLFTLGSERITHAMARESTDTISDLLALSHHAILLVSAATMLPALMIVLVGEIARIRTVLYYVIGGGVALASMPLIAQFGGPGQLSYPGIAVWQVFATSGFVGGFIYWIIAGRTA